MQGKLNKAENTAYKERLESSKLRAVLMEWNLIRALWLDERGLSPLAGLRNQVRPLLFPTAVAVGHNLSALTGLSKCRCKESLMRLNTLRTRSFSRLLN